MSESVMACEPIDRKVLQTRNAARKYYSKKIRVDPEFYAAEKARIKEYKNNRYKTDPEFAEKCRAISREIYQRKKQLVLKAD
jgi:pyrroloquinoline quinone (PQQ) biosynthesis protein C